MRFRMSGGCGPRGFDIPDAIFAMGMGGRGWRDASAGVGGFGGGAGGAPHGRARRMFDSGELRLVLLKLIADQPRHGWYLIRAIEEMTHGEYAPSPGIVYPTLTMLEDMGLIEKLDTAGSRRAFAATAEGKAHLAERAEEVEALIARLTDLGDEKKKTGGAPIGRAVGNLLSALWHRVTRDDADEDRLHEIAAILDEAAQRIERLK
jgi:DNA-binding PadR family transcriptional regulator